MSDKPIYSNTIRYYGSMAHYLRCNSCGKTVSTAFQPFPTATPDKGLIVRAWIECPECMQEKQINIERPKGAR